MPPMSLARTASVSVLRSASARAVLALALAGAPLACAHGKIPGTEVEDTDLNREILKLVEAYTRALESRDAEAILEMVSPRFFEDNGNTSRDDDYDYAGLEKTLREDFAKTKAIQMEVRVDRIEVDDDETRADAFIMYTVRGHAELPSGSQWKTGTDRSRLRFERQGGKWMIISGI